MGRGLWYFLALLGLRDMKRSQIHIRYKSLNTDAEQFEEQNVDHLL